MTQEEKAKAYDEALRKIRPLYERAKKEDCPIWSTYEYIFTELAESDDERIRKEIIEYLKLHDKGENDYAHAMFSKWFNWFEKKKYMDNSYTNVIFPFKAMVKETGKIVTIHGGQLSSDCKYWEKYQSSSENGFKVYNPDEIINIKETLSYPEKQKPAERSEDDRIRQFFAELATNACGGSGQEYYEELGLNYDKVMGWLEMQKEASKAIEAVERIDKYIEKHTANAHDMKDSHPDKKYYSGVDDTLSNIAGILEDVYSEEKQKEQEPEEKPINWTELNWKDIVELEGIINNVNYEFRNGIGQESFGKEVLEEFREYKGDEYLDEIEQKPVEPIEFSNEFENQVSHLLASVLNGEHEYNEGFVKYAAQSLLGYAKKGQKPTESISQLTVQGKGVYKICPHCKSRMIRDESKVYTSIPPQYGYNCPKCGAMEFDTVIYDSPEMEEQSVEWIEDERIRKELLSFIESVQHSYLCATDRREKWISYLENQKDEAQRQYNLGVQAGREEVMYELEKEQKISEYPLCETIKDKIKCYIANHFIADREVITDIPSIVHAMEEGVRLGKEEQKTVEEHCDLTEILVPTQLPHNLASGDSEKPNNQYVKWGEGEQKVLDTIIKDYEDISKTFCGHSAKIEFLKALKNGEYGLPNAKTH